jgi:3-oxoacyl-[acyl-carrier protein] reductase
MFDVRGTRVIVTGGTKGIGKGIVNVFAKAGAKVLIVGRNYEEGNGLVDQLEKEGFEAAFFQADVSSSSECQKMGDFMVERFGGIDVVIANAGIYPQAKLEEMDEKHIDQVMGVNFKGAVFSVKACAAELKKSTRGGRVILISSITGPLTGLLGFSIYGASKNAMLGFMRTLALELAPDKITVNAICPGNTLTEGLISLGEDYLNTMSAAIPLNRLGTVEDMAHAALFLASKEAGFITGQALVIDGGQTLHEA